MDLLKPFREVRDKLKKKIDIKKKYEEDKAKLQMWQKRLNDAVEFQADFRNKVAEWDEQYMGTKKVEAQSGRGDGETQDARQVINITFQNIEQQIQIDVPQPRVNAIEGDDDGDKQKMISGLLTHMASGTELKKIVSENERIVKKNSVGFLKVVYDTEHKTHKRIGRIKTISIHPKNVIPQPGVFRIAEMDYLFHVENRTINQIVRKYGKEYREVLEGKSTEFKFLDDMGDNSQDSQEQSGWHSVVEAWYRDDEGDVGVLTWVNETILKDEPKFFFKRDENGKLLTTEQVEIPLEMAQALMLESNVVDVECHVPKSIPFISWYNVPKEKSFYGISDAQIMRDKQESMKKVISRVEGKLMKGTNLILTNDRSLVGKITNAETQVKYTEDPQAGVAVHNLTTPVGQEEAYYQLILQAAKDEIGVTEAFSGRIDGGSLSGKAIEGLAANSEGRLQPKLFEKDIAFEDLYKLWYDFILAYYDDEVPFTVDGANNKKEFGTFSKGKLIKQDDAGAWYYPEWEIFIDSDVGISKDKNFIMRTTLELFGAGAMDAVALWTVFENIGFPNATMIKQMIIEQQELEAQRNEEAIRDKVMQEMKGQADVDMKNIAESMSDADRAIFESADPETQAQMIEALKGQIMPQGIQTV